MLTSGRSPWSSRVDSFVLQAFSNTGRRYKVALSLAAIILLCFWSQQNAPLPTLTDCLAGPLACDGKLLSTDAGGKVESVEAWGFWLRNGGQRIRVVGQAPDVRAGDTIFLDAIFHKEGYLDLRNLYVSRYRWWRILVSLPALLYVLVVVFRSGGLGR